MESRSDSNLKNDIDVTGGATLTLECKNVRELKKKEEIYRAEFLFFLGIPRSNNQNIINIC